MRGNTTIHRGKVLTCGTEQFFAHSNYQIQHESDTGDAMTPWIYLKFLISEKTLQCLGTPMAVGAWRGLLAMADRFKLQNPLGT